MPFQFSAFASGLSLGNFNYIYCSKSLPSILRLRLPPHYLRIVLLTFAFVPFSPDLDLLRVQSLLCIGCVLINIMYVD